MLTSHNGVESVATSTCKFLVFLGLRTAPNVVSNLVIEDLKTHCLMISSSTINFFTSASLLLHIQVSQKHHSLRKQKQTTKEYLSAARLNIHFETKHVSLNLGTIHIC
jgi:putative heme iron utilization protein